MAGYRGEQHETLSTITILILLKYMNAYETAGNTDKADTPEVSLPTSPACGKGLTRRFHGARFPASGTPPGLIARHKAGQPTVARAHGVLRRLRIVKGVSRLTANHPPLTIARSVPETRVLCSTGHSRLRGARPSPDGETIVLIQGIQDQIETSARSHKATRAGYTVANSTLSKVRNSSWMAAKPIELFLT